MAHGLPKAPDVLFVDLDGVLADFHGELVRLHGHDPADFDDEDWRGWDGYGPFSDRDRFWAPVHRAGEDWWADLPKLPWTDSLWESCKRACDQVVVLTSPADSPGSVAGKYRWVRRNLDTRNMLIGRPKAAAARHDRVLIDDRQAHLAPWVAAGGVALPLKRPWTGAGLIPTDLIDALNAWAGARRR